MYHPKHYSCQCQVYLVWLTMQSTEGITESTEGITVLQIHSLYCLI